MGDCGRAQEREGGSVGGCGTMFACEHALAGPEHKVSASGYSGLGFGCWKQVLGWPKGSFSFFGKVTLVALSCL